MSLWCMLGRHDWKYERRIWYADHGACFDQITRRKCRKCGKEEHGKFGLHGPYPCNDNTLRSKETEQDE